MQHFPPQPAQFFYILCSLLRPYTQYLRFCAGYSALSGPGSAGSFRPALVAKSGSASPLLELAPINCRSCRKADSKEEMER